MNPNLAAAYDSRGTAKEHLGRMNEPRADYQKALDLAQGAGDEKLIALVKGNLRRLDNNAAP